MRIKNLNHLRELTGFSTPIWDFNDLIQGEIDTNNIKINDFGSVEKPNSRVLK